MENTVPVFPLQLVFLCMIVGVKWWVCREAPIFDSDSKPLHSLLTLLILSDFTIAELEMSHDAMLSLFGQLS